MCLFRKMSTPEIFPRAFFGLRPDIIQNAHYISDFQVLYPAGSVLVIHNFYEKRQKYIKLQEKSLFLELITVSHNRKLAAIIENGEKGQIVIYDLQTLKRRRTLNLPPDSITNRFETISFTYDDKFIMAITGDPDWIIVSYNWEKGKIESSTKANYPNNPAIPTQICCSPSNHNEVCLIGPGLFRLLCISETIWKQYGFQKADQINLTTACWLTNERILCGTVDGKLLLIEAGDLKAVYNATTVTVINIKEKNDIETSGSTFTINKTSSDFNGDEDKQVRSLISFTKGFAYSCKTGLVHMFEKKSNDKYKKRNVFRITDAEFREVTDFELNTIKHLSINLSQEKLLATTNRAQIYSARLWGPDLSVAPEIPFKILGEPLHHGAITGLAMCVWKPIFLTCGKFDRTVRLWNYETHTVEIVKYFNEDVFSVSLHPTGHFAAIGFTEKLRFMIILLDDIQPRRDFPIRECELSAFSSHGHFLAAVMHTIIKIFNYVSFQEILSLNGHTAKINSVVWTTNDKKLVSCGEDGMIIEWNIITGEKLNEVVTKGVSYFDLSISSDGKFIYAIGNDGLLKEITNASIIKSVDMNQKSLDRITLSRSDVMMFLSGDNGAVLSVRIPMTIPLEYATYLYHFSAITHMKLSYDDQTLVTASNAGALIIWKLSRIEGKTVTMDKDFAYSKDILISRTQLQEKINLLKDLSVKLFDLEMDHARLMRKKENDYIENIKEIQGTYTQGIQELKDKIERIEMDQENQLTKLKDDVNELKLKQEKEMEDLESNYKDKLTIEYEKIENLTAEKDAITADFESRLTELITSKETTTKDIITMYEQKIITINQKLQESYEENAKNINEHKIVKQQFEEDTDREIVETKAYYEKILKEEHEINDALKAEAFIMKKKYMSAQKDIDEYHRQVDVLQTEYERQQSVILALEKDIQDLKKEIVERDMTIVDKEKRIYDLRKKVQELEKFKFLLDYKIKGLKNQIDPKDREIKEKKEQIEDMQKELENFQKINTSLELQRKELREKINATEKEANAYEDKHNSETNVLRQIKVDIYNLYQHIEDFQVLKRGIKKIYLKYIQNDISTRSDLTDSDIQKEFMIQREFLEKTIFALQSTIRKNIELKKDEGFKVLEDNVILVEELNRMRKMLKETMKKVKNLENLAGVKSGKSVTPREAFVKLQQCLRNHEIIRKEYDEIAVNAWNETRELNERIEILYDKIEAMCDESGSKAK